VEFWIGLLPYGFRLYAEKAVLGIHRSSTACQVMSKKKLAILSIYFGQLPVYYPYFLFSAKRNSDIDFYILTDQYSSAKSDKNVHLIPFSYEELRSRIASRAGLECSISDPWKLNEVKPLLGLIMRDLLANYSYWGWSDIDIIWGNISKFLSPVMSKNIDIYTTKPFWTAGHCTILKNADACNLLPLSNPCLESILCSSSYTAFEESGHRWFQPAPNIKTLISQGLTPSFYDLVCEATSSGLLKSCFDDSIIEFMDYSTPFQLNWRNGEISCCESGEKYMYFHLIVLKKIWKFYIPSRFNFADYLYITRAGIFPSSTSLFAWWLQKIVYSFNRLFSILLARIGDYAKSMS